MIYKIVTNTLANRLKKVLDLVISPKQSAFVQGILIFNNVMLDFECTHALNNHKKEKKNGAIALKIYMSKAY